MRRRHNPPTTLTTSTTPPPKRRKTHSKEKITEDNINLSDLFGELPNHLIWPSILSYLTINDFDSLAQVSKSTHAELSDFIKLWQDFAIKFHIPLSRYKPDVYSNHRHHFWHEASRQRDIVIEQTCRQLDIVTRDKENASQLSNLRMDFQNKTSQLLCFILLENDGAHFENLITQNKFSLDSLDIKINAYLFKWISHFCSENFIRDSYTKIKKNPDYSTLLRGEQLSYAMSMSDDVGEYFNIFKLLVCQEKQVFNGLTFEYKNILNDYLNDYISRFKKYNDQKKLDEIYKNLIEMQKSGYYHHPHSQKSHHYVTYPSLYLAILCHQSEAVFAELMEHQDPFYVHPRAGSLFHFAIKKQNWNFIQYIINHRREICTKLFCEIKDSDHSVGKTALETLTFSSQQINLNMLENFLGACDANDSLMNSILRFVDTFAMQPSEYNKQVLLLLCKYQKVGLGEVLYKTASSQSVGKSLAIKYLSELVLENTHHIDEATLVLIKFIMNEINNNSLLKQDLMFAMMDGVKGNEAKILDILKEVTDVLDKKQRFLNLDKIKSFLQEMIQINKQTSNQYPIGGLWAAIPMVPGASTPQMRITQWSQFMLQQLGCSEPKAVIQLRQ